MKCKVLRRVVCLAFICLAVGLITAGSASAEDYRLNEQNKALYGMIREWYAQRDSSRYLFYRAELIRYTNLYCVEHATQMDSHHQKLWLIRLSDWKEKRQGRYIPSKTITGLLCLLIEDGGVAVATTSNVLNQPIWYRNNQPK